MIGVPADLHELLGPNAAGVLHSFYELLASIPSTLESPILPLYITSTCEICHTCTKNGKMASELQQEAAPWMVSGRLATQNAIPIVLMACEHPPPVLGSKRPSNTKNLPGIKKYTSPDQEHQQGWGGQV